jgi:DNA-binding PadR family transcriptional regulator
MKEQVSDAELTILGLLAEQPRHGYELERVIEERGVRDWTALGFSSIYYLFDKLARRGLVEAPTTERPGKSRNVFRLTSSGQEVVAEASLEAITTLSPIRPRVLVGLANSPGLPPGDVLTRLHERAEMVGTRLAALRETRAQQEPLLPAVAAIFDYGEAMLLADQHWARATHTHLEKVSSMEKYDIKKAHKALYSAPVDDFTIVEVPELQFLAIDGYGDPNTSPAYAEAIEALYSVSYALKFESKKTLERDFAVGPLEGTWRADDKAAFTRRDKSAWSWTMMINQPDWITHAMFVAAVAKATSKKNLRALPLLRLVSLTEGTCVQILHLGSYDDEGPTVDRLHNAYLSEHGLLPRADHHEIYLSDARRIAPAKLKTILRQPVQHRHSRT